MKIPIVDENDNVIGEEERSVVHEKGLNYRSVNIVFITPDQKIIFQKRSKTKETNPGLLSCTVGGHVDAGDSYESAAIREIEEETGVIPKPEKMKFVTKIRLSSKNANGLVSERFSAIYCYPFHDDITSLVVEPGENDGFVAYGVEEIKVHKEEINPVLTTPEFLALYPKMFAALYENQN